MSARIPAVPPVLNRRGADARSENTYAVACSSLQPPGNVASQFAGLVPASMPVTTPRRRRHRVLARGLLEPGAMELLFSLLETLVALAVAVELVGVALLIHRLLR
jgi:hypothetical protein